MRFKPIVILIIVLLFSMSIPLQANSLVVDFEFTTIDNEVASISDYYGKPILIEWAATWCTVCKNNQESIAEIYDEFKNNVTFISISFFASGDTIEEVEEMKTERGYPWLFGLDTNKYSGEYDVFNGYNWLLDSQGHLVKTWNGTIVSPEDLATAFENILGITNTFDSEGLIVGSDILVVITTTISSFVLIMRRSNQQ